MAGRCFLLTDCADDARSAVVSLGSIVDVETGVPLHLGAIVQVVQSVTHNCLRWFLLFLLLNKDIGMSADCGAVERSATEQSNISCNNVSSRGGQ